MLDNPAGRLRAVMEVAQSVSRENSGADGWQRVLRDDDEDMLELHILFERLGLVVALPASIRREVLAVEDVNHELYLRHIGVWEQAFSSRIRFDAQWAHFMEVFLGEHLYSLETCDELLSRMRHEPTLTPEFLMEVSGELDDLRERLLAAALSPDVLAFLLTGLDRMRDALRHYRFTGMWPVTTALEASLGAAQLQPEVFERSKESEVGREYWSGMGRIYARVRDQWGPYRKLKGAVIDILALPSGIE